MQSQVRRDSASYLELRFKISCAVSCAVSCAMSFETRL